MVSTQEKRNSIQTVLLQAAKENKEDLKQQFLHDFEEMLHMASAKKEDET